MYFSTGERHYEQFSQYSALKVTVVLYIITIGSTERVKLVEASSGKPLRNLVMFDSLKTYKSDNQVSAIESRQEPNGKSKFALCRRIVTDRMMHGKQQYLTLSADSRTSWREIKKYRPRNLD